jgi:hypothetical protein
MANSFVIDRNPSNTMEPQIFPYNGTAKEPSMSVVDGKSTDDLFVGCSGPFPPSGAPARIPKKKRTEESDDDNQDDIFLIDDGDEGTTDDEHHNTVYVQDQQLPPAPDRGYEGDNANIGTTSAAAAPSATISGFRFSGSGELKLPEGVKLPSTITPELLSERLREMLFQLPVDLMKDAFTEYDTAVTLKGDTIRSHQAYLHGVLKRYVQLIEKDRESKTNTAMGKDLTGEVKVVQSGYLYSYIEN